MKTKLFSAIFICATLMRAAETQPSLATLRDPEVVAAFRSLPVQDEGRIKPLDTVARFSLLRFYGKQSLSASNSIKDPATGKNISLSAVEWMVITMFRPDLAKDMSLFVVDNSEAIVELGLEAKGKRDRYSYNDLLPARAKLMQKRDDYAKMESKERTPVQRVLVGLGTNFLDFELLCGHFDFIRRPVGDDLAALPAELKSIVKDGRVRLSEALPAIVSYSRLQSGNNSADGNAWLFALNRAYLGAIMSGNSERVFRVFPSKDSKEETWMGPGPVIEATFKAGKLSDEDRDDLARYENLYLASGDAAAFKTQSKSFSEWVMESTKLRGRGEASRIALEVHYNNADYFYNALYCFISALLCVALSWAAPAAGWGRGMRFASWVLSIAGVLTATAGIVVRCLIMHRPPISTLYETVLYITTTAAALCLITEWLTRKGYGLALAAVIGTSGMYLSILRLASDEHDSLQVLQAVLITNFWLATHVPCINLGYAAGMVAAFFSMTYFALRLVGLVKPGNDRAKDLTRMAYGFISGGLLLSLVGTVLGGIWANYSWGRFWGWDPKENGALMIVLMNLIILHARMGGYIREVGFHCCCIMLGMIVVFSWFGVNLLGVGLHSYGFMEGARFWINFFWGSQLVILAYGIVLSQLDKHSGKKKQSL